MVDKTDINRQEKSTQHTEMKPKPPNWINKIRISKVVYDSNYQSVVRQNNDEKIVVGEKPPGEESGETSGGHKTKPSVPEPYRGQDLIR